MLEELKKDPELEKLKRDPSLARWISGVDDRSVPRLNFVYEQTLAGKNAKQIAKELGIPAEPVRLDRSYLGWNLPDEFLGDFTKALRASIRQSPVGPNLKFIESVYAATLNGQSLKDITENLELSESTVLIYRKHIINALPKELRDEFKKIASARDKLSVKPSRELRAFNISLAVGRLYQENE